MQLSGNSNGETMKLYRKLNCDNLLQINQQIIAYIQSMKFEDNCFWNPIDILDFMKHTPLFTTWYLDNQLPLKSIAVTRGLHANCCGPHTDTPPARYKLSWPVLNTEHTWNRWFRSPADTATEVNSLGGTTYLDPHQLTEIDRMRVDTPALIATAVPHDVWFEPGAVYPRIGLQCQLFLEPDDL